jgi:aryl-alcohol dehydrogenase-like predicted oxidoreductase
MVWSPLAGGFLSGKYSRENPQGDGGRLTGFDILPFDRDRAYALITHRMGNWEIGTLRKIFHWV